MSAGGFIRGDSKCLKMGNVFSYKQPALGLTLRLNRIGWRDGEGGEGKQCSYAAASIFWNKTRYRGFCEFSSCSVWRELSPCKPRLQKRECQISPSSLPPGEVDCVGFGGTWCPGRIPSVLTCWSFHMTKVLHISRPPNQTICYCLLLAISTLQYLKSCIRVNSWDWSAKMLQNFKAPPCVHGHTHVWLLPLCCQLSLLSHLLGKTKGASAEYERNSASQHWLLPHIY